MKDELKEYWQHTISGHIYSYMQEQFHDKAKLGVENPGAPIEVFLYNTDRAHVRKKVVNGDNIHQIQTCIESYEYKRQSWWRQVVDAQTGVEFVFLDPPLMWVAKDADITDWETLYRPSAAVQKYGIYTGQDMEQLEKARARVRQTISQVVSPIVSSDYSVQFLDGGLRLVALTDNALESRYVDNETYNQVLSKLQSSVEPLHAALSNMTS